MRIPIDDCPAGSALDAAAARAMGKPWKKPIHGSCCMCHTCGYWYDECQCGYSEDDSMALTLVDAQVATEDWGFAVTREPYEEWRAVFWLDSFLRDAKAPARPLAITRAFCRARGITEIEVPDTACCWQCGKSLLGERHIVHGFLIHDHCEKAFREAYAQIPEIEVVE